MAGRGKAPKAKEERRNAHAPRRGEWLPLPPENTSKPPAMPTAPRGGWAAGTRSAWKQWWRDPASLTWTPGDIESLRQLAYLHHDFERMEVRGKASMASEVRQRMDGLGLTQKGKRDLRLQIIEPEREAEPATRGSSRYGHLRVAQ